MLQSSFPTQIRFHGRVEVCVPDFLNCVLWLIFKTEKEHEMIWGLAEVWGEERL